MSPRALRALALVVVVGGLLGVSVAACSTVYQPAPSARIGLVIRNGGAWYVKDGQETAIGPLGGDLAGMMAGRPDAIRLAQRSRTELAVGVPSYVCGLVAVVVGLTLHSPERWIVAGAGAAVAGTGIGLMGAGFTNAVDAVNIYNDHASTAP